VTASSLASVDSENPTLLVAYAMACLELGREREIEPLVDKVLALDPGDRLRVGAYATWIEALRSEGKYREGNRVGRRLLAEGASVESIDDAMVNWGFPVGPITLSDEVGIDVGAKIAKIMAAEFGDRMTPEAGFSTLVDDDRKGRKNGRGFYEYEGREKKGVDATVYETLGVTPETKMPRAEIQERLSLPLINEAVRCLEEGILRSARDGDIGAIFGFGFPPFRGGPFWYVDQVGADTIVAKLDDLAAEHGTRFEPAQLLRDAATDGRKFRT